MPLFLVILSYCTLIKHKIYLIKNVVVSDTIDCIFINGTLLFTRCTIVYFCKYFPRSRALSVMRVNYCVYAQALRQSRDIVASACAFLAYMGAHQVENIYKDGLGM